LKKPRRTKANKAHASGDCPEGVVGDDPAKGPRTALKNPVTNLLITASGPEVRSVAGRANFCVVVVGDATGAAEWGTGNPEDSWAVPVMVDVLFSIVAEGAGSADSRRTAASEKPDLMDEEAAVIADRREVVGPFRPASGNPFTVTGPSAGITGATVPDA
jgi:hypothetical protein